MIQGLVRRPQQRVQIDRSGSCARNGAATLLATSKGTHLGTVLIGPGQLVNEHWSRAPSSLLVGSSRLQGPHYGHPEAVIDKA